MGKAKETQTEKPKAKKDKPKQITIINNAPRIITLTYPGGVEVLQPGPNAVDRHVYAKHIKGHETVAKYASQGIGEKRKPGQVTLPEGQTPILKIDESGPPSTKDREVEDAVALVGTVCDMDLLYEIEGEENRPSVRRAIDERRDEIGTTEPAEDK
jgi:hypothetical protein